MIRIQGKRYIISGMLKPVIIEADDATAPINTIFLQEQQMGVGCCIQNIVKDRMHMKHRLKHASPQDCFDHVPGDSKVDRAMSEIG